MYDLNKGWILISSASHYCTKTRIIGRSGLLMGIRLFQEPHQSDRYLAQPRPSSGHIVCPADAASVQRTLRPSSGHFVRPADTSSVQRTLRPSSGRPGTLREQIRATVETLFNSPGRPGLLNKTSSFEVLFNRMVLSFFCRLPQIFLSFGLFWLLSHVLLNRMLLSFFCRLPEFVLSTDRGVRWTDEVSAGRTKCPLDGRSVRWTDEASAGRTQRPLDGQGVRWTDEQEPTKHFYKFRGSSCSVQEPYDPAKFVIAIQSTSFTHSKELCEGPCAFNRHCHMEEEEK